jgi:SAM-dependent methyltransferase
MKRLLRLIVKCVPGSIRSRFISSFPNHPIVKYYSRIIVGRKAMYGELFVKDNLDPVSMADSRAVAGGIADLLKPGSVVDVGCCAGVLLERLSERGISVTGTDFSDAAQEEMDRKGIPFFKVDLENDIEMGSFRGMADIVTCFEVAEHLPPDRAMPLVRFLCRIAPAVCFSAAPPGQGGVMHFNEQLQEYWVDIFRQSGFEMDRTVTEKLKKRWQGEKIDNPRVRNFMLFRRRGEASGWRAGES